MKKIYFLASLLATYFTYAQYGCDQAIQLSHGFSETGITTPGTGSAPETWVTSAQICAPSGGEFYDLPYTTVGDDYLFSYTSGDIAGETVELTIKTNGSFHGLLAFKGCNGTELTNCIENHYMSSATASKVARITNLGVNETVYFIVGIWAAPNNLNFDVVSFNVIEPQMAIQDIKIKEPILYPNPAKNVVNVSFNEEIYLIKIVNQLGQKVLETNVNGTEASLNVEQLPKGNYSVEIISESGKFTKKLIK
jgi:hypothetical protein